MDPIQRIRVLHYLESFAHEEYVRHCLDLDLVASGPDAETAERRLDAVVRAHVEQAIGSGNYALLNTPAPMEYWDRFLKGAKLPSREIEFRFNHLPIEFPATKIGILPAADQPLAA